MTSLSLKEVDNKLHDLFARKMVMMSQNNLLNSSVLQLHVDSAKFPTFTKDISEKLDKACL